MRIYYNTHPHTAYSVHYNNNNTISQTIILCFYLSFIFFLPPSSLIVTVNSKSSTASSQCALCENFEGFLESNLWNCCTFLLWQQHLMSSQKQRHNNISLVLPRPNSGCLIVGAFYARENCALNLAGWESGKAWAHQNRWWVALVRLLVKRRSPDTLDYGLV